MTWPITEPLSEVKRFSQRAPCGCRYHVLDGTVKPSPYRMQRCFTHMKLNEKELADLIERGT